MILTLAWHECTRFFKSGKLWRLLALCQFALGVIFYWLLQEYLFNSKQLLIDSKSSFGLTEKVVHPLLAWSGLLFFLITPLMATHCLTQERKNHTLELYINSPLSSMQIIWGKFIGILVCEIFLLLPVLLMPLLITVQGNLDMGQFMLGCLGLILLLSTSVCIGIFVSSFSKDILISTFLILLSLILLSLVEWVTRFLPSKLHWIEQFALLYHCKNLLSGMLDTRDIIYFCAVSFFFLQATQFVFEKTRFLPLKQNCLKNLTPIALILPLCVFAYAHPYTQDLTKNKINTLGKANLERIAEVVHPLSIDVYTGDQDIATQLQNIVSLFQKENSYISFQAHFTAVEPEDKAAWGLTTNNNLVLGYEGRKKAIDINPVKLTEKTVGELIQRVLQDQEQWLVFLNGHGEPDPFAKENRHYSELTAELQNHGIRSIALNLADIKTIPHNTQILVIADNKTSLLPQETQEIIEYVNRGGNLLWMVNANSSQPIEKLENALGIKWQNTLLYDHKSHKMGTPHPAISLITQYKSHSITHRLNMLTVFPWATPIEIINAEHLGWKVTPLLNTNSETSLGNQNSSQKGSFTIGIAMERGQQRVVVIGNSNFLSNGTIHNYGNHGLANNIFSWLNEKDFAPALITPPPIDLHFAPSRWILWIFQYGFPYGLSFIFLMIGWWSQRRRQQHYR